MAGRSRSPVAHRPRERLVLSTPPAHLGTLVREWREDWVVPYPIVFRKRSYLTLANEFDTLPGYCFLRLETPYILQTARLQFSLDFSLWCGDTPATATEVDLLSGSSNGGWALVFHWPGAPDAQRRIIVSRLIGMSLFFRRGYWHDLEFFRFDSRLHVHHRDGDHSNCFLNNLQVITASEHAALHNRLRRR